MSGDGVLTLNEHGVPVTWFTCAWCGREFGVTSIHTVETWGDGCLLPDCESYDPARDVDHLFGADE